MRRMVFFTLAHCYYDLVRNGTRVSCLTEKNKIFF